MLDAPGNNVVGYLPGERARCADRGRRPSRRLVQRRLRQRHRGVAAVLALARALATAGHRPRHTLCFTSRTAEEYGLTDSAYGWCTGAWAQISETHRAWAAGSPFHLNLEASGHPGAAAADGDAARADAVGPSAGATGAAEGWLTSGWYTLGPPGHRDRGVAVPDLGRPGVSAYTWERSFMRTDYHTQYDTIETIDFAHLERLCRFYAFLLLERRRRPRAGILDHAARARDSPGPRASARRPRTSSWRRPPRRHGIRARTAGLHGRRPWPQRTRRARHNDLPAHAGRARRRASGGGARRLSAGTIGAPRDPAARARRPQRARAHALRKGLRGRREGNRRATHPRASWGAKSHPPVSPDLWRELASLRGEAGATAPGPWIERSLKRQLERSRAELARRLAAMTRSLSAAARASR